MARLLAPSGELFVQTDVEERAELYECVVTAHGAFVPAGAEKGSARIAENPWGPGATTLEWKVSSPPPFHTFEELPRIR